MAVTAERFSQGLSYDAYKAQMTRNQDRFIANEAAATIDADDKQAFINLDKPLNVLVICEDWCGDVIDNLPVLGKLAEETGKLNIRVFLRDQNLDIMDQYLKDGQYRSIPVFVFFDDAMNQQGFFIERPESVTDRRAAWRKEYFAAHPEAGSADTPVTSLPEEVRTAMMEAMAGKREEWKTADNKEVISTLRTIVSV